MYERYAIARDRKGLKDYAVAKETGISPGTLSDWKKGMYEPKIDKLEKIAILLGVSVAYIRGETDDINITPSEEMGTVTNVFAYTEKPKHKVDYTVSDEAMEIAMEYDQADNATKSMISRLLAYAVIMSKEKNE